MRILLLGLGVAAVTSLHAQPGFTRIFQFSLTPGISSNGMHPGGYTNYFSLNLTSGYSAANYLLEFGAISNLNERETRGLQIAGIANLTGSNSFAGLLQKEIDKRKREGFEANLSGAQFSGVANVVLNNAFGWQASGGVNVAKGSLQGFQVAGISNTVYKYSFGVQLAGLYNVSAESMDGVQLAGLFNITAGELYGVQFALFNKAGTIHGINSFDGQYPTALQLGMVNTAKSMNGFQVGLINFGGRMQGTQIGLINIYRKGKTLGTRDGTSIGLVNIGSSVKLLAYTSDIFYTNIEVSTGTVKNARINEDMRKKEIQNGLIYAWSPKFIGGRQQWALGYGLKKYYFNRSATPRMNSFMFIAFGADWMHVNHDRRKLTRELSLLSRPFVSAGTRLHPKNHICFFFASVAYNVYLSGSDQKMASLMEARGSSQAQHWPGFSVGVMTH
jgi:hypothetical protein